MPLRMQLRQMQRPTTFRSDRIAQVTLVSDIKQTHMYLKLRVGQAATDSLLLGTNVKLLANVRDADVEVEATAVAQDAQVAHTEAEADAHAVADTGDDIDSEAVTDVGLRRWWDNDNYNSTLWLRSPFCS